MMVALEKLKSLPAGHWHVRHQEGAPESMRICLRESKQNQPTLLMAQEQHFFLKESFSTVNFLF